MIDKNQKREKEGKYGQENERMNGKMYPTKRNTSIYQKPYDKFTELN